MFYKACQIVAVFLIFTLSPVQSVAQEKTQQTQPRQKIGLVLGGGGARGLAHVGVIQVLEENHIPVDVITGTSMGSIVGSLYASGYTSDELTQVALSLDWAEIFKDRTARSRSSFRRKRQDFEFLTEYKLAFKDGKLVFPKGVIQGQNLFLELSKLLGKTHTIKKFENLPIPFRLVATDLDTGEEVVLTQGDLASAVFASMAIPGVIPPVERDGRYLIDGGFVNNVPVDLAKDLGAEIIIAVNVGTEAKRASELGSFLDVLRQTQIVLTQGNTRRKLEMLTDEDILITPDLGELGATSFGEVKALIEHGRRAAIMHLPKLVRFRLNDADWAAYIATRHSNPVALPIIDEIQISQNSNLSDNILRRVITQTIGDVLNTDDLNHDIKTLYNKDIFSRISYEVTDEGGQNVLEILANADESADGYFKFGVVFNSNFENNALLNLGVSYTKPQVNRFGGEWRSEITIGDRLEGVSEFYQPIGAAQQWFLEPSVFFGRDSVDFFDTQNRQRGELEVSVYGTSLQGGLALGEWGELRTGIELARANLNFTDNTLGLGEFKFQDVSYLALFSVDTLDNLSFPTTGQIFIARYDYHSEVLGGDLEYNAFDLLYYKPFTTGRHTFGLRTHFQGETGRDANRLGGVRLGGFRSLPGFSENELSGQYAGLVSGNYYYRLNEEAPLFDTPMYIGASLEAGNVFQDWESVGVNNLIYGGSVFAGLKSPLGPVLLGFGYNDTGASSIYLSIGRIF